MQTNQKCTWKFSDTSERFPIILCYNGISNYDKGTAKACQNCAYNKGLKVSEHKQILEKLEAKRNSDGVNNAKIYCSF